MLAGIDEAGRGPVIGPMVMAITSIKREDEFKLKTLGVKDSKLLSLKRRNELMDVIKELCQTASIKVSAKEVDKAVFSEKDNLNWLEARKAVELINSVKLDKVILDCPSTNLKSYKDYIQSRLNKKVKIIVEHKADLNYPIVAAASVIAKVERDKEISKIKKQIGKDLGSGYASDPKTQVFVKKYWDTDYSKYMRKSWNTWQRYEKWRLQKSLGEF